MSNQAEYARRKRTFFHRLDDLQQDDETVEESEYSYGSLVVKAGADSKVGPRDPVEGSCRETTDEVAAEVKANNSRQSQGTKADYRPRLETIKPNLGSDSTAAPSSRQAASVVETTPLSPPGTKPATSAHMLSSTTTGHRAESTKIIGKRKKGPTLRLVPEPQQVFRGLTFYFFPNNDIDRARRMRIEKAQEYGATWTKEWSGEVTHVIVECDLRYADLLKFLSISHVPPEKVLVNEKYASDCIVFRTLLDPRQPVYHVPGQHDAKASSGKAVASAETAQSSLPLKPATRDVLTRQPRTPSRIDESSHERETRQQSSGSGKPYEGGSQAKQSDGHQSPTLDDALEEMTSQAHSLQNLPLEEDNGTPPSSDLDSEEARFNSASKVEPCDDKIPKKGNEWQDKFLCMSKHDGDQVIDNPNARTIEVLQRMVDYYEQIGDNWRNRAYRQAIAQLKKQRTYISTKQEAAALPYVGERLAQKIEEITITDKLQRLEQAHLEPSDVALGLFLKVYGVGYHQAMCFVSQGYKTLNDLQTRATLSENQRIGVEHYDDFLSRIPRVEVQQHGAIFRKALQKIDPAFQVIVGGSFRRGAATSGDVDLIITKAGAPLNYLRAIVLDALVPSLFAQGFLKARLSSSVKDRGTKWHGASALPGSSVWRRIDLLLVPWDELGAALIYFTGNDIFNRSIRLLASKKGMRLNQRGLYKDVVRGRDRTKLNEGTLVEGQSERRIFELLGVPWKSPQHRNC